MIKVNSTVKMNLPRLKELSQASIKALELTAEALHNEVKNTEVIPFAKTTYEETKVYGKRGQFRKDGREYKGKLKKQVLHAGGQLNENTFVDNKESPIGKATLVSSTPYARHMYYHPEYQFYKGEHKNAKGNWYEDWQEGGKHQDFAPNAFKEFYRQEGGV